MRLQATIILLFLCLIQCFAGIDEFQSRQYSASDGLPNHTVRHIQQDSHGFVWIATLNGLSRYDGKNFTTFLSQSGNPLSLSDNRVYSTTEDYDAYLWIETTGRIYSCFDLRKGVFVKYTEGDSAPYNKLFIAKNGNIWLSNADGGALKVIHMPDRQLKSERYEVATHSLPSNKVNTVFETHKGDILLGTSSGFSRVSDDKVRISSDKANIFTFFESKDLTYAVSTTGKVFRINSMDMITLGTVTSGEQVTGIVTEEGTVALFTDRGTWQMDLKSGKVVPHPSLEIKNGQVLVDNKGRQWIYNHTGQLTFLSLKDRSYNTLSLIPPDIMGRIDHERYRVAEDCNGTIWISTYGNGLFAFREDDCSLQHFTSGEGGLIGSNSLRGMMIDATGALWLGTGQSGITTMWHDTRDIRHFLPNKDNPADRSNSIKVLNPGMEDSILFSSKDGKLYNWMPGDSAVRKVQEFKANIYSMLDDGKGVPLYGTRGDGLFAGDRHFKHVAGDKRSLPDDNIYFIHRDRKGRIWIGTFGGGITLMTPDAGKGTSFHSFFSDIHGRKEQRHLIEDLDGRFWIGTSEGLLTFHPDSLISDQRCFKAYSKSNSMLNCNEVRFLMRDSKGDLWIATGNDGVIRAATTSDGEFKIRRQYTVADGLGNNSIQSIAEDDEGILWVATEYGIARLNPKSEIIENFIFSEEPQGNTYAEASVLKCKDGTLLFGTTRGIVNIDPRKFLASENGIYPFRFTRLTINGIACGADYKDSPLTETIDYTDRIELKPHQNSFAVDFAVMDFRNNSRFRYSYILEGYDDDWSAPSPEGSASFSYIPSGRYTLKVKCLDGGRILAEGQLEIVVKAPWWNTQWAWIAYVVVISILVWIIIRRKVGMDCSCVSEQSGTNDNAHSSLVEEGARVGHPFQGEIVTIDHGFLTKLEKVAQENIGNVSFSVDDFAAAMNLGRAVFYRKLKEVADTTPNEYLKKLRMNEAARLLRTAPDLNIAEVSDRVGFSDSLYFSKCFKAEFGQSPSAYRKSEQSFVKRTM